LLLPIPSQAKSQAKQEGCEFHYTLATNPTSISVGLGARDKEDCRRHCSQEAHEKLNYALTKACTYEGEELNFSDIRPCFLVDDLNHSMSLEKRRSTFQWDYVYTEKKCLDACSAARSPEQKLACFWGEKKLFSDFSSELKVCRLTGTSNHISMPSWPIFKTKCDELAAPAFRPYDKKLHCGDPLLEWGSDVRGVRSTRQTCQLCRGWPETCDRFCSTEQDCKKGYLEVAAQEEFAFANWDNKFVERKGKVSSLGNQRCQIVDSTGTEIFGDRYDNGRAPDCDRSCRKAIESWAEGSRITIGLTEYSGGVLKCVWDGKELFATKNVCQDFYRSEPAIALAIANAKTGFFFPAFSFSAAGYLIGWNNFSIFGCEAEALHRSQLQATWDRRFWGSIPVSSLLNSKGEAIGKPKNHDEGTSFIPKSALPLFQKLPEKIRGRSIVLTSFKGAFQDPLDLKVNAKLSVDLAALQKFLVEGGHVRTYIKGRETRAAPKGNWLKLQKAYEGKDDYRLLRKISGLLSGRSTCELMFCIRSLLFFFFQGI